MGNIIRVLFVVVGFFSVLTFADAFSKKLTFRERNMSLFSKLDPGIQGFMKQIEALNLPPANEIPVPISRDGYEKMSRLHGGCQNLWQEQRIV